MKLHRVHIEQFRQFRTPLEISDLQPGINLIVGPNESGKSTVVRAIRAAFFERYKSGSVEDLQPWGDSAASPSVTLAFDWQGERWTLVKSFLKRKRCDLDVAGHSFSGEEAEEKLAGLLGYQFASKGASKAEHWGIPGLLWMEQGTGQEIQAPVRHAGSYLKSLLSESLGEVASTVGDALTAQVEQEWLKLWTAKKRTPTGEYADVLKQHETCQQQLVVLDAEIAAYRQQVDRLAQLREQQAQDAAVRPWESYRAQAASAQTRLAEAQDWMRAQQQDEQALQRCRDSQQSSREQLDAFARRQDDLRQRDQARRETEEALHIQEARLPLIQARTAQAQQAYQEAEAACSQARRHEKRAALQREVQSLAQEQADLQDKLARTRALLEQLQRQREERQSLRVDAAALKHLQDLIQNRTALDIAQQSVATRLHFDLHPGQRILLGSEPLAGEGERLLLEALDLEIQGVGRLRIQPGGKDLGDLARRREAAQTAVQTLLAELQVGDLAQAEAGAEQYRVLQEDCKRAEMLLAALAPEGVESLAARQAQVMQRHQALAAELAALGAIPVNTALTVNAAEAARDAARESLKVAEQAASLEAQHLSLARQALDNARLEWQNLQASLQSADQQAREQALNRQLVDQRAQEAVLKDVLSQRAQQISAANPDILAQDVQRLNATANLLEAEVARRRLELASLASRLEVLGASGLEERRAERAQQCQYLERRRAELQRRALALDLLRELLRDKRLALTRRIQAPLQRHLQHYLQLLFVRASLTVDEDLVPGQLVRTEAGHESYEDYAALSFGAREQMGLISRLAYADLLREAGRPTLIILDDALVNSDAQRLAQMKRILFDAAQRHQILLFSCHPDNWHDLGVIAREMTMLRDVG